MRKKIIVELEVISNEDDSKIDSTIREYIKLISDYFEKEVFEEIEVVQIDIYPVEDET